MATTDPITTDELIEARMDETGLTREQLLLVVAKSALVRHLATGPDKDRFVLKSGTLLAHAYKSPRQSVRDADYSYIEPALPTVDDLIEILRIPGTNGFYLDPAEARWTTGTDIYEAKGMKFSIQDITVALRGRGNALDISVSVRSGECLDGPIPLIYTDTMLAGEHRFSVMGLSLGELAAEKVLGWASKDQSRHFIDLAYIARDYREVLDGDKAATLIRRKFEREKSSGRYRNIRTVSQLADTFSAPARIKLIRDSWTDDLGTRSCSCPRRKTAPRDRSRTSPTSSGTSTRSESPSSEKPRNVSTAAKYGPRPNAATCVQLMRPLPLLAPTVVRRAGSDSGPGAKLCFVNPFALAVPEIQMATIVGTSIAAELAKTLDDLAPLIATIRSSDPEQQTLGETVLGQVLASVDACGLGFVGADVGPWTALAAELSE